ncbi:MAG TPA: 4-hydroxy-tetrahydrodipicolinate reductase [Galbitalea sp.]|jgi:4-hydroxy-tetrahydrodipicolinate reductase|nr:4-hydroxy-tetrahydrodipicolinate reductase [Galbitalea sp.]
MTISVAVVGATGRMGRFVSRLIEDSVDFELAASIDSKTPLDAAKGADLIFDVTVPAVSQTVVEFAIENDISAVVGTSGWSLERIDTIRKAAAAKPDLAVLIIPNFSIGSVLATSFAAVAARFFDSIEIVEAHDVSKVDSPSGTAIRTAELIGEARAKLGPVVAPHHDQRARGQLIASVPIHSVRMQGVGARQEVMLGGRGELLTLKHEAVTRDAYEAGIMLALRTAPTARGIIVGLDKLIDLAPATE